MIRRCTDADSDTIYAIVNDAAVAYKGVIPGDGTEHGRLLTRPLFTRAISMLAVQVG